MNWNYAQASTNYLLPLRYVERPHRGYYRITDMGKEYVKTLESKIKFVKVSKDDNVTKLPKSVDNEGQKQDNLRIREDYARMQRLLEDLTAIRKMDPIQLYEILQENFDLRQFPKESVDRFVSSLRQDLKGQEPSNFTKDLNTY